MALSAMSPMRRGYVFHDSHEDARQTIRLILVVITLGNWSCFGLRLSNHESHARVTTTSLFISREVDAASQNEGAAMSTVSELNP
jgi:hypothetical protein